MATPNYGYEKRQKELAKKKKKEEKLKEKAQRKAGEGGPEGKDDEPGQPSDDTPSSIG
ncbi:MAG TPA: hypothetical protein VFX90_02090 [Rhodoferax sp.]|nr:hypothetical protein [Rhodoferax sp.]